MEMLLEQCSEIADNLLNIADVSNEKKQSVSSRCGFYISESFKRLMDEHSIIQVNLDELKYLDQKDIESLGWKPDNERQWSLESPDRYSCFYMDDASMTFYEDRNVVSIKCKNKFTNTINVNSCSFRIKNKSELKALMQQLNIIE